LVDDFSCLTLHFAGFGPEFATFSEICHRTQTTCGVDDRSHG
jgi:hypothetical protein